MFALKLSVLGKWSLRECFFKILGTHKPIFIQNDRSHLETCISASSNSFDLKFELHVENDFKLNL